MQPIEKQGRRAVAGSLAGVRVVDFTHIISGPLATQTLADLGADVIKVEDHHGGDVARELAPHKNGVSHHFAAFNRNKRSIRVDLKSPLGHQAAMDLIRGADVVMENFSPGVMAKLGLGYDDCRKVNGRLVYCSISGFGQTGPWAQKRSLDLVAQAYSGVMSTNGAAGGPPLKVGTPIGDTTASMFATTAVISALYERDAGAGGGTGEGKYVDIGMFDALLTSLANWGGYYHTTGTQPERVGSGHYVTTPYGAFESADGEVIVAVYTDGAWVGLCAALSIPEFAADERFSTGPARGANRPALHAIICPLLKALTSAQLLALLEQHGVPCAPINTIAQAFENPHAEARDMTLRLTHPAYGEVQVTSAPLRDVMRSTHTAPPLHGEHTAEILAELGWSAADIETFMRA
jgi:formyl-CoA transferase/CoA:oxalate CoA-transferase